MKKNLLLLLFISFFVSQNLDAQCVCTDCPNETYIPGPEVASIISTINVSTTGVDDLGANPLVSVDIDLHHTWLGDVSMSLVSPSGLHYGIMGDDGNAVGQCGSPDDGAVFTLVPGNFMPLTEGVSYGDVCNGVENCIEGEWTLACGAGAENIHNGAVPAPNCDLDDYNVAGHPVSGEWTLYVNCVCNIEFGSILNNWGINFADPDDIVCEEDNGGGNEGDPIVIETDIFVGETGIACLPEITDVVDLCPEEQEFSVEFTFDAPCVVYTGIASGTDTLCIMVTDEFGNSVQATIIVNVVAMPQPYVWAGDANNDGIVNTLDALYIGLGYGATGVPRENASEIWQPEYAVYWGEQTQVSDVDYKFFDTNGDGEINAADMNAVVQNYGQTHDDNLSIFEPFVYQNELISLSAEPIEAAQGETVSIPLTLNTLNGYVMTGLAFDVVLDPAVFDLSTVNFTNDGEIFEGSVAMSVLEGNVLHAAMTQTDGMSSPSQGVVGHLTAQVRSDAPAAGVALTLEVLTLMNTAEVAFPLAAPTEVTASVTTGTDNSWLHGISVYPQPASAELFVQTGDLEVNEISLYTATGRLVSVQKTTGALTVFNTSDFAEGVYLLSFTSAEGTAMRKVVLAR